MDTKCVWECQGEKNLAKGRAGENNCSSKYSCTNCINNYGQLMSGYPSWVGQGETEPVIPVVAGSFSF